MELLQLILKFVSGRQEAGVDHLLEEENRGFGRGDILRHGPAELGQTTEQVGHLVTALAPVVDVAVRNLHLAGGAALENQALLGTVVLLGELLLHDGLDDMIEGGQNPGLLDFLHDSQNFGVVRQEIVPAQDIFQDSRGVLLGEHQEDVLALGEDTADADSQEIEEFVPAELLESEVLHEKLLTVKVLFRQPFGESWLNINTKG